MDGSALAPPKQVGTWRWLITSVILGAAGSTIAIAAFGQGTYLIGPLVVQLKVSPDTTAATELAIETAALKPGVARAETHSGFVSFRGTVTGISGTTALPDTLAAVTDPTSLATLIRDEGKSALRKFGLKIGLLTLGGGAAGGFAVALIGFKTRRIFQGLIAGVVLVGVMGLLAWQTYDIEEFEKTQFRPAATQAVGGS